MHNNGTNIVFSSFLFCCCMFSFCMLLFYVLLFYVLLSFAVARCVLPSRHCGSSVFKTLHYWPRGCQLKFQHCQVATVGPLSEAPNPQLLRCWNETRPYAGQSVEIFSSVPKSMPLQVPSLPLLLFKENLREPLTTMKAWTLHPLLCSWIYSVLPAGLRVPGSGHGEDVRL